MKKRLVIIVVLGIVIAASPAYCFFDYLFGGDSNQGAIGNNVLGDARASWSGNPAYHFDPFYKGPNPNAPPQQAGAAPSQPMPNPAGIWPQSPSQQYPEPTTQYNPPAQAQLQYVPPAQAPYPPAPNTYYPPQGPAPQQYPQQYAQPGPQQYPQQYGQPAPPQYPQQYAQPGYQQYPMQQPAAQGYGPPMGGDQYPQQGGAPGYPPGQEE
jgi:hypothetical protein